MAELPAQDFAILDELHRSAGGSVYLGRHRRTGAHVILKVNCGAAAMVCCCVDIFRSVSL